MMNRHPRFLHSLPQSLQEAQTRRAFLAKAGLGFGSIALADLLHGESSAAEHQLPAGSPILPPGPRPSSGCS